MKDDGVTKDDGVFPPSFFLSFLFLCSFVVHFGLHVVHIVAASRSTIDHANSVSGLKLPWYEALRY
jgi:hypothetical protein